MQETPKPLVRMAKPEELHALIRIDAYAQSHASRVVQLERALLTGTCLVAEHRGELAAYLVLEQSFFGQGFIPLVCVARNHRKQGLGSALLAAAEAACPTSRLFTSTNASNIAAQRLFARAGFVRSGIIENLDAGDPELVYFKAVGSHGAPGLPSELAR